MVFLSGAIGPWVELFREVNNQLSIGRTPVLILASKFIFEDSRYIISSSFFGEDSKDRLYNQSQLRLYKQFGIKVQ